jgi:hypothetical protein
MDVGNTIYRYTQLNYAAFTIETCEKAGHSLAAFVIQGAPIPMVYGWPVCQDHESAKIR